jgi:hypothetical protein
MLKQVQESSFRATIERNYAAYECGYASGCRGIIAVSDSLLNVTAPESESSTENDADKEQAELLDKFAP